MNNIGLKATELPVSKEFGSIYVIFASRTFLQIRYGKKFFQKIHLAH